MQIIKGKIKKPFNILVHGIPGVGKSYFASQLDKPLFIGAEEQDELDADKAPRANSFKEFKEQLSWALNTDHGYKTLVVDTIDSIETLLHQHILDTDPKKTGSMAKAHGGYGAGYNMALNEMTHVRESLSQIREKKDMNIVIICHTVSKKISDPTAMAEYDEHKLTLHEKVESLFVDWVSAVLFMTFVVQKSDSEKFAFGDGKKVIYTEKRPGFLAKNRYKLPAQLEVEFDNPAGSFLRSLDLFYKGSDRKPEDVKQNILGLLENVNDQELIDKVMKTIEKQKTTAALEKTEARVKELINA